MQPPNGVGVILLALLMPIVFILGILAAIAIPAYSTIRFGQVQEGVSLSNPARTALGIAHAPKTTS